jgi:hypothetical protein
VILIEREGGLDGWTFNGWFLQPMRDLRGALVFDGFELIDYDSQLTRRWRFDGTGITSNTTTERLWCLDAGMLFRPQAPSRDTWRWNGTDLVQVADPRPDHWRASEDVPLLVIAYAAGLL